MKISAQIAHCFKTKNQSDWRHLHQVGDNILRAALSHECLLLHTHTQSHNHLPPSLSPSLFPPHPPKKKIQVIYSAITTCYLCVLMPAAARPRQQAYNDLSEWCVHEGEAGTDKSTKELTCWNNSSPSLCLNWESNPCCGIYKSSIVANWPWALSTLHQPHNTHSPWCKGQLPICYWHLSDLDRYNHPIPHLQGCFILVHCPLPG